MRVFSLKVRVKRLRIPLRGYELEGLITGKRYQ